MKEEEKKDRERTVPEQTLCGMTVNFRRKKEKKTLSV